MSNHSILRDAEYAALKEVSIDGKILDLGGNTVSDYHGLVKGEHSFTSANIDGAYGADLVFDVQERFPIESGSFDGIVCLNLLEHVFGYENAFKEAFRVLKPGGVFALSIPFMHHVHGCPDDYFRYTDSALRKILAREGFEDIRIRELGTGVFSLFFQSVSGALPRVGKPLFKRAALSLDGLFSLIPRYREAAKRLPLGYFVTAKKR